MSRELQRAFEAAVKKTDLDSYCVGCGGLQPGRPDMITIPLDTEPPTCPKCGLVLAEDGRPAGYRDADGVVHVSVVSLVLPASAP